MIDGTAPPIARDMDNPPPARRGPQRERRKATFGSTRKVLAVLAGLLMVTSAAIASVVITYNTSSTATLSLKAPPVQWSAGPDSSGNNLVASWSLSNNATNYALTLRPIAEASVNWTNLTTLTNTDVQAYTVSVSGPSLAAYPKILDYRINFYAYGTNAHLGELNLKTATSLDLGSMAAGAKWYSSTYIKLDSGTGASPSDLPASVAISVSVG